MKAKFFIATIAVLLSFSSVLAMEKIDINTAPLEDLIKIVNIGDIRAKELINLRPFNSLDDLIRIKGISKSRIQNIKDQGLAWVSYSSQSSKIEEEKISTPVTKEKTKPEEIIDNNNSQASIITAKDDSFKNSNFKTTALIALVIAIFSSITIMIIKNGYS